MTEEQLIMTTTLIGGLALFLFGMKIMSEGLQKVAGAKMRKVLSIMTTNRLAGVGTGVLVTCAVQSSSATTVMLVSFVHAGLIDLAQSIGVVMGANIGTTVTGWLVALVGFKVKVTVLALPAVALGFFPRFVGARKLADWGEVLIGFGVLFLGLYFMKESMGDLKNSENVRNLLAMAKANAFGWRMMAVGIGAIVTLLVQSSSATMVMTMTLATQGLIDVSTACALVLGENIGTTITANLAAIGTSTIAKRTARAHFVFNVGGALWAVLLFMPFVNLVVAIWPSASLASGASEAAIAATLAAFHTTFNIINTALFLPFTKQLAWFVTKITPQSETESTKGLKFLDPKVMNSPPMALHAARAELKNMIEEVESMLGRVLMLVSSPDKKLGKVADAIRSSEETVDFLEREIISFMVEVTKLETSFEQSHEVAGIITAVSDVERMGDHCESLLRQLTRSYDKGLTLSDRAVKELTEIGERVSAFITLIKDNLEDPSEEIMPKARKMEGTINDMRKQMRHDHVDRLRQGECLVDSGLIFIDMLTSFEKMGDHAFNVAQMIGGER